MKITEESKGQMCCPALLKNRKGQMYRSALLKSLEAEMEKLTDAELHYLKKQSAEIHCYKSWKLNCNTVKAGR